MLKRYAHCHCHCHCHCHLPFAAHLRSHSTFIIFHNNCRVVEYISNKCNNSASLCFLVDFGFSFRRFGRSEILKMNFQMNCINLANDLVGVRVFFFFLCVCAHFTKCKRFGNEHKCRCNRIRHFVNVVAMGIILFCPLLKSPLNNRICPFAQAKISSVYSVQTNPYRLTHTNFTGIKITKSFACQQNVLNSLIAESNISHWYRR